ncbi:hypothetical protein CHS0354_019808 [Potamilus streckersoni]|uniref:Uncharacterized protein n=1 Tax=Potamilus streckersoni TaxID=2493646 RepID=A0AAE0SU40_9BIVA|nr:hypothetical protein CHS0354_019808 [Potamilus streckersoni]
MLTPLLAEYIKNREEHHIESDVAHKHVYGNGNLQIGDRSYDLRPAVSGDTPAKLLKVTDGVSRRYLLLDQTQLQQENLVENKDILQR